MDNVQQVAELIKKARAAQAVIAEYSQEQIDALVKAMGKIIDENAAVLAKEAVEETGLGVYEHKIIKNSSKAQVFWDTLRKEKTVGIISRDDETGVIEVAKPLGVIGCVSPTTNPNLTPLGNGMFAVKAANALIVAPHPRSKKTTKHTIDLMRSAVEKLGAPADILQCIEEPSIEGTQALMQMSDVVVATGGMGMVRAAYSSGKPALGVGQGNVQVVIDKDYSNYNYAAKMIILGRTWDRGVICAGEQCICIPKEKEAEIKAEFVKEGAYFLEDETEIAKIRQTIFPDGDGPISRDVVGQSPQDVAKMAGVSIPEDAQVIIMKATGSGRKDLLCREKMCPCMIYLTYNTIDEGIEMAKENLLYEGAGHSASIWSDNQENIDKTGLALPVARVLVNQTTIDAGGGYTNGLYPTASLGCGSWGNNSISENLAIKHMMNTTRIALPLTPDHVPTAEEIWSK
ncbi:MAG: aldehyde dehydrogenase family protein [Bacillota bacterium]|jgi:succinate-semialdehyde dehydrogenase